MYTVKICVYVYELVYLHSVTVKSCCEKLLKKRASVLHIQYVLNFIDYEKKIIFIYFTSLDFQFDDGSGACTGGAVG